MSEINGQTPAAVPAPEQDEHALVGAYALDAVDDGERVEFERHLAGCPLCTADVPAFREVLAVMARSSETAPPTDLVASTVDRARSVRQEHGRRRGWLRRLLRRTDRG
jgi:anti-sigma factor RsiW